MLLSRQSPTAGLRGHQQQQPRLQTPLIHLSRCPLLSSDRSSLLSAAASRGDSQSCSTSAPSLSSFSQVSPPTRLNGLSSKGHSRYPAMPLVHTTAGPRGIRVVTKAGAGRTFNPKEVVKRELALQSNRLSDAVRDRVSSAIESLGFRVTVGDVAAKAGVKISEADEALKALAYDSLGTLEVSNEGDVVYVLPRDFRSVIRNRSLVLTAKPILKKIGNIAGYLARVAFGVSLISSVALVWLAIAVISSSGQRDDRNRQGNGGYYGGGGGYYGGGPRMFLDVGDLFLWFNPAYRRQRRAERIEQEQGMGFLESIFSFVFGDGDPNADFDEERWKGLGAMIRAKGGVVTAEEMAPYLDPPAPRRAARRNSATDSAYDSGSAYDDEGFVLPALIKFGGEPFVDEKGNLLYKFEGLLKSGYGAPPPQAQAQRRGMGSLFGIGAPPPPPPPSFDVPLERTWQLTAASQGQVLGTVALGVANIVGIAILGGLLTEPQARYILATQGLGFIFGLFPALQLYAASFFAIPAFRWFANASRNAGVESRNDARTAAVELINNSSRDPALADKLEAARSSGSKVKVLSAGDSIYTSDLESQQGVPEARELADFDDVIQSRTARRRY